MRNSLCLLLVIFTSLFVYCQPVVIRDHWQGICYVGLDDYLTIAIANKAANSIKVSTDNGTIRKGNSHYILRADSIGFATINIKWKTSKGVKHQYTEKLRVESVPKPFITLSGQTEGAISAAVARAQIAPSANVQYVGYCARYTIVNFMFMIIRDDKIFFRKNLHNDNGVRFSDDTSTVEAMKALRPADKLFFFDVVCQGLNGRNIDLKPMQLNLVP